jgi:hypothetical protein
MHQQHNVGLHQAAGSSVGIAPYCTYQTPEYFFSYRREKQKKVQWSGIVTNDLSLAGSNENSPDAALMQQLSQ